MTSRTQKLCLAAALAMPLTSAQADVLLTGVYDSPTTNANQVDVVATSNSNPNQLDLATFSTLIAAGFSTKQAGVATFDTETVNGSNINATTFSNILNADSSVFGQIRRTNASTNVVTNQTGRTPISGANMFGGQQSFGFEFVASDLITAVGLTIMSREGQTAGNMTVTATFADSDGQNAVTVPVTTLLGAGNGTADTFLGFAAPTNKYLTGLAVTTPYFASMDDLAFSKVVPEPGSLGLAGLGLLAMMARRRR